MSPKILLAAALMSAALSADVTLFDFGDAAAVAALASKDVEIEAVKGSAGPALRVKTGTSYTWPSIYIRQAGGWDLSAYGQIQIPLENLQNKPVTVFCRVDSQPRAGGGKRLSRIFRVLVEGERSEVLRIPLLPMNNASGLKASDFFGMRGMPFLGADGMYCDQILEVVVYVDQPKESHLLEYGNPVASGSAASLNIPEKPFPFIDAFGQFIHRSWPGKVKDEADLKARFGQETADLASHPRPSSWNKWGGWAQGPALQATGFFRAEKYEGKWWLVDPDGRLFFSHGIDCVTTGDSTPLDDRQTWFASLPAEDGPFAAAFGKYKSHMSGYHYYNREVKTLSFLKVNLMRKYPGDWQEAFIARALERLPSWGLNTIANWSRPEIYLRRQVPYTATLGTWGPEIAGSSGYWGKFKDVFHPDFRANLVKRLANHPSLGDPWCLGFFVDNELAWGDETSLALGALLSPATQPAKIAFVEDLKKKYGDIQKLNAQWGTTAASWDEFLAKEQKPDAVKARADLRAFYTRLARVYFQTIRDCLKAAAPKQLYLGCRFAWDNDLAIAASRDFCDVVSFNIYAKSPLEKGKALAAAGDKPLIIGEFHFGALDRGQFHTGLVAVKDQAERAATYTRYVTDALKHPNLVGTHWFQFMDSPTLGRALDGENYQIGFVDNCDTPYAEIVAASRALGQTMYAVRSKK
ncbi:MAG: beta-agarase [Spirochaetes bacterium]|nr:beta-agarase [Spirochaetota bacterium]